MLCVNNFVWYWCSGDWDMELVLIAKLEIELYWFMGEWLMFLLSENYFCIGE